MRQIWLGLLLFFYGCLHAQLTLRVTAIPANTPANAAIYVAGSFNNWDPGNTAYQLQADGPGAWAITIPEASGSCSFKFTRGSWTMVEGNASGSYLPNRTANFTGTAQTLTLSILSWEDLAGSGTASTAASNVQILDPAFFLSPLNKYRRIWLYLPPDYATSTKQYPVLYMHDGQNLFDNATSFSGEWQVDESLNLLASQGDYGAIVVGIDNGGADRLNEYSPWVNAQYGGGQGDLYVQSIIQSIKPFIDSHYRTLTTAAYTGIAGSSMGGLISAYAAERYPQVFGKIGIFSPAFWFCQNDLLNDIQGSNNTLSASRCYLVASQNESTTLVSECNQVITALQSKGLATTETRTKYDTYGSHSESYWKGEFSAAYKWLFQQQMLNDAASIKVVPKLYAYGAHQFWLNGTADDLQVTIYNAMGSLQGTYVLHPGQNEVSAWRLPAGLYILKGSGVTLKWIWHE
ncbi:MAG: alpha-dextran endo-1,6-alpha-glucosidase [Flavobacterium sp. BFFFF2]|nr:MAG: alpha-dextran endo-1,6-alpha-glucosidase [Flavobacterium sp. BFFFF2]